jgi:predicted nuclease with TOPRIM domain
MQNIFYPNDLFSTSKGLSDQVRMLKAEVEKEIKEKRELQKRLAHAEKQVQKGAEQLKAIEMEAEARLRESEDQIKKLEQTNQGLKEWGRDLWQNAETQVKKKVKEEAEKQKSSVYLQQLGVTIKKPDEKLIEILKAATALHAQLKRSERERDVILSLFQCLRNEELIPFFSASQKRLARLRQLKRDTGYAGVIPDTTREKKKSG